MVTSECFKDKALQQAKVIGQISNKDCFQGQGIYVFGHYYNLINNEGLNEAETHQR